MDYLFDDEHLDLVKEQVWECKEDISIYGKLSDFELEQFKEFLPSPGLGEGGVGRTLGFRGRELYTRSIISEEIPISCSFSIALRTCIGLYLPSISTDLPSDRCTWVYQSTEVIPMIDVVVTKESFPFICGSLSHFIYSSSLEGVVELFGYFIF